MGRGQVQDVQTKGNEEEVGGEGVPPALSPCVARLQTPGGVACLSSFEAAVGHRYVTPGSRAFGGSQAALGF